MSSSLRRTHGLMLVGASLGTRAACNCPVRGRVVNTTGSDGVPNCETPPPLSVRSHPFHVRRFSVRHKTLGRGGKKLKSKENPERVR